jgi:tRNA threonylcarbamoyladenosine modification (KEOPS) complex Cgi121 subunit
MLYHLKEYGKYLEVTGYRYVQFSKAEAFLKASRKEAKPGVEIQFFDADLVATQAHIYFAAVNALEAFQSKVNISKSLAMETMLYASALRQIQRAIELLGIKPQTTVLAVAIFGEKHADVAYMINEIKGCLGAEVDEQILEMTEPKERMIRKAFQISDAEIGAVQNGKSHFEAVVDLVVERGALLSTQL